MRRFGVEQRGDGTAVVDGGAGEAFGSEVCGLAPEAEAGGMAAAVNPDNGGKGTGAAVGRKRSSRTSFPETAT